jgi:hypothetical protein
MPCLCGMWPWRVATDLVTTILAISCRDCETHQHAAWPPGTCKPAACTGTPARTANHTSLCAGSCQAARYCADSSSTITSNRTLLHKGPGVPEGKHSLPHTQLLPCGQREHMLQQANMLPNCSLQLGCAGASTYSHCWVSCGQHLVNWPQAPHLHSATPPSCTLGPVCNWLLTLLCQARYKPSDA